jgi:hypothetical protein
MVVILKSSPNYLDIVSTPAALVCAVGRVELNAALMVSIATTSGCLASQVQAPPFLPLQRQIY